MIETCLHCGGTIWLDDFEGLGVWTHMNTGRPACEPTTVATPSRVRIG